jgi:hypothetical protein
MSFHIPSLDILDVRQFTSIDVCAVVGINAKQLEHVVDPKRAIVRLTIHSEDRTQGKRRMFSGSDILKISTVFVSNEIGFPQRFSYLTADTVATHAQGRLIGYNTSKNLMLVCYPIKEGTDWVFTPIYDGMIDEPKLPVAYQSIQVDRLIDETLAKIRALLADEPLPDFNIPDPVIEADPYGPTNDFFLAWSKDDLGRNIRVGLTFEETAWYEDYLTRNMQNRTSNRESEKYLEIFQKHEAARFTRMAQDHMARTNK